MGVRQDIARRRWHSTVTPSPYTQKVLIALYENGTPFELRSFVPESRLGLLEFGCAWEVRWADTQRSRFTSD
jgi:hypothetical protein